MKNTLSLALALAITPFLASCSKSSSSSAQPPPSGGVLTVLATDGFLAHARVEEARIELSTIRVAGGGGADPLTIHEGSVIDVVLTDLRSGITAELASAEIPEDTYTDVYLQVTGGYLRLENGAEFSTQLGNMTLPPGPGPLHGFIVPAVQLSDAGGTLLIDFDLTKSFSPVPAGEPLNATSFDLTPTLRAVDLDGTGTLQGLVSRPAGGSTAPVEKADVYLLPPGSLAQALPVPSGQISATSAITTTASGAGGSFKILGLEEGLFDVLVETDTERGTALGVRISVGQATTVDIVVKQ